MARKYDVKLVEAMRRQAREVEYEGVPLLLKPIPEGGADGDMDPRAYKSMRKVSPLVRLLPRTKKPQSTLKTVMLMRQVFGQYKGVQLVKAGVETSHVTVPSADGHAVPVRIYRRTRAGRDLPLFVYYHGGGFFGGSPDIVEQMCKLLVLNYDCVAFNVDYRLCPENHYPAPFDDCFYATRWAHDHAAEFGGSGDRLAVGGDSAGGNLAAAVTLRDRDEGAGLVKAQVLLYPSVNISGRRTDFYHGTDITKYHRSRRHAKVLDAMSRLTTGTVVGEGNLLEKVYLQGHLDPENVYASPLLDSQRDVPPTLLLFGEHDFLACEDWAYAKTLRAAGRSLKTIVYRGLWHGFADQIGVCPQAEDSILEIAHFLSAEL